jgi:hypothetical protein
VELGAGEARAQRQHPHALVGVLQVQRLAEVGDPRLAGAVGGGARPGREAGDAADVQHRAAAAREHRRQRCVGQAHDGADVEAQQVLLVRALHLVEGALGAQARVVDQQVDALAAPPLDPRAAVVAGEVGREHLDVDRQGVGQGAQAGLVAGDEDQVGAAGGELAGEGGADAGRRAGDECSGHGGDGSRGNLRAPRGVPSP